MTSYRRSLEERFWSYVDFTPGGCWLWRSSSDRDGYGIYRQTTRCSLRAHRLSFYLWTGAFPRGQIDHLCRVRGCVRPDHLEDVTPRENVMRSASPARFNAERTHCQNGHQFDAGNTITVMRKSGKRAGSSYRRCRACYSEWRKERYRNGLSR